MGEDRIPAALRREVAERAQERCEYCDAQERFANHAFGIDHVIPRSKGGRATLDNLAFACYGCNSHKYNKVEGVDPVSGEVVPLYHPRRNCWEEHFSWNGDFTLVIGLSSIGRATVAALRLNRPGNVNLRRVLYKMGEHPPSEPGM